MSKLSERKVGETFRVQSRHYTVVSVQVDKAADMQYVVLEDADGYQVKTGFRIPTKQEQA